MVYVAATRLVAVTFTLFTLDCAPVCVVTLRSWLRFTARQLLLLDYVDFPRCYEHTFWLDAFGFVTRVCAFALRRARFAVTHGLVVAVARARYGYALRCCWWVYAFVGCLRLHCYTYTPLQFTRLRLIPFTFYWLLLTTAFTRAYSYAHDFTQLLRLIDYPFYGFSW